jgi:hypothetical protein
MNNKAKCIPNDAFPSVSYKVIGMGGRTESALTAQFWHLEVPGKLKP